MQGTTERFCMNKNEIQNSSDMFLYKAQIDLNSAKYLLDAFNEDKVEIDIEKIYFDLQQCAEKSLKSLLSKHKVEVLRTHDIELLIDNCKAHNIPLVDDVEKLIDLSDFAVEGRYSIIHDDMNEAQTYIIILERLLNAR